MGERKDELDFDELEILLGEIPNVTSGNPHCEESGLSNATKDIKRVSLQRSMSHGTSRTIRINSSEGHFTENTVNIDDRKMAVNKILQSPIKRVQQGDQNLPNGHSLTSALSKLNFSNGMTVEAENPNFVIYKSLPIHNVIVEDKYAGSLKNPPSDVDHRVMIIPPPQLPNNSPGGFDEFDMKKSRQECSNLLKLKKQPVIYSQPVGDFSGAVPFAHGVQGFQFLSDIPDQQQYFFNAQSRLPYMHSQQLSQPHITWRQMEEEQFYRMQQQYMYMQQLRNQSLEAQPPIQANGSVPTRLMSRNPMQPCYEMPISHQHEQKPYWNSFAVPKSLNLSNPAISSTNYGSSHMLDKVGKQNFPENILTRSQGLNSIKAIKFGSFGGTESRTQVNQNGRVLSDGYFCHTISSPNAGFFNLDSLNSQGLFLDSMDLKHANLKLQPKKYNFLDEVYGKIYLMAKDQNGCRFLQRKFTEGTTDDIEKIFIEIIDHIVELMTDSFGNYLVQKLLEVCNEDQQMQILHAITRNAGDLVRISCEMHGTRAVQKVIETLKTPAQYSMVVASLAPGIVTLMKDANGSHVAQRCLQYLMPEYREFLYEAARVNCVEIATDRHGCCVFQKCLSHSDGERRSGLICEITSNALILSQDQYGNYVVQFVFELQVPWATVDIIDQLKGNYGDLSMQKFSSNVVEKCLKYAGEERCSSIIQELISNSRLDQIMQDPYGNYVIQAALNHSKGALHAALVEAIKPHVPVLRTSPYGKKVLSSYSLKK